MNDSRLTYLFQSYFNKTATPNERDELMELLSQAENDEQVKILLTETWQQFIGQSQVFNDSQGYGMLSNILKKGNTNKQVYPISAFKQSFTRFGTRTAAAILFFGFIGLYFWLRAKQSPQQIAQPAKIQKPAQNTIVPGGNKALLTLSDGSSIGLDSNHVGTLGTQGDAKVMNLNTATLAYNAGVENNQGIVYNTLSTPSGGQYQLILSDGTRVWLNASSSIHFPTIFKGKERNVTITGETYFEVAKNEIPFKISIGEVEVQVLGTHFNVMAYNDENTINTTLLEGSVKVSKGSLTKTLVPGQESRINNTGTIKVVEADIEEVVAWKNGWFQFNSYDIEKVMRQISRWYDVEVVYVGKMPTGHFSGSVSRGNNISQVLKIMQAGGVGFRIDGRKVVVYSER